MSKSIKKVAILAFLTFIINPVFSQDALRWNLKDDGGIEWQVKEKDSHIDHVEMSGFYLSGIVYYGVENGELRQKIHLVFPMLRTIPNDTHASLAHTFENETLGQIKVDGKPVVEYPTTFYHKGILTYQSKTNEGIVIKHQLFPSTGQPLFIDRIEIG